LTPESRPDETQAPEQRNLTQELADGRLVLGVLIYGALDLAQKEASKTQILEVMFRALCRAVASGCFDTLTTTVREGDPDGIRNLRQEIALVTYYISLACDHTVRLLERGFDLSQFGAAMAALRANASRERAFVRFSPEREALLAAPGRAEPRTKKRSATLSRGSRKKGAPE
jgi:hypothetical protein